MFEEKMASGGSNKPTKGQQGGLETAKANGNKIDVAWNHYVSIDGSARNLKCK